MLKTTKNELLQKARLHIELVRKKIIGSIAVKEKKSTVMTKDAINLQRGDALAQRTIIANYQENIANLKQLYPSPYFNFCEFVVNGEIKRLYFSKFSFNDENIYSWVTPAATLRFEKPGETFYVRPDGKKQEGLLTKKDQYMIVDGKLIFFSTEEAGKDRELIHQEHFTKHKQGFVLPEVVEQMEKAQDLVIRAHYKGPFLISGPAGSGKTTLALHRIAYLLQSPETMEFFSPESILVIVQDNGTKDYFSHLLPDLGIKGVSIITFADWAFTILKLKGYKYIRGDYPNDSMKFTYEKFKLDALKINKQISSRNNIFALLETAYSFTDKNHKALLLNQKKEKRLDRFDLTLLLQNYLQKHKEFSIDREYYEEAKNGKYRKKKGNFKIQYNLAVIDEFQNYLPEQIKLFKTCMNQRLNSLVYVGDLAQQTQFGTMKDWQSVGEELDINRSVVLQKVYRNTKQILDYINYLGYGVTIPVEIKDGPKVKELLLVTKEEEINYVKNHLITTPNTTTGILCKDKNYLDDFKQEFKNTGDIYCFSFSEAQGVEFDQIFIVGINQDSFSLKTFTEDIGAEVKKIYKDLLYVALTRAMTELHILGKDKLSDSIKHLM